MVTDYPSIKNNTNIYLAVYPDGSWSFPLNLYKDMTYIKRYTTTEVMIKLEELKPDVMVQHIQCEDKYKYNAMFEILNIPFIGSDSHVSANIVDKGNKIKNDSDTPNTIVMIVQKFWWTKSPL